MSAAAALDHLAPGRGIVSVCSAHPLVIEAALLQAAEDQTPALIEATCNQVNQDGGYTGMTPAGFRDLVHGIADRVGFPRDGIILGGDHLGPNPWRHLPADQAMARADAMVAAYVEAGFAKIHLDTSMGCAGEAAALGDAATAGRAARLAAIAEAASRSGGIRPRYVIGTEVPTPGGAPGDTAHMAVTRADAVQATYEAHRLAFGAGFERAIALVVQPGVEFGHSDIAVYQPERARGLSAALASLPGLVFEAHSTDYQPRTALAALVRDGSAILKVGPALTFALRETLYGLDQIAAVLDPEWQAQSLAMTMERAMLAEPIHWRGHYGGSADAERILRHYSYSDRIRYYWPSPAARDAVARLLACLEPHHPIAPTLISQFLPRLYHRVAGGALRSAPRTLLIEAVRDVLRDYAAAAHGG